MRVLMLNYEYPPLGGGAGNAMFYLLNEFSKYIDLEIDVITSSTDKYGIDILSPNIRIHKLNIGKNNKIHFQSNRDLLIYSGKAFFYCRRLLKQKSYDLIHAFFSTPCGYLAYRLKRPYIVSLRGSDVPFYNRRFKILDTLLFQTLSKQTWKHSRAVIANSQGLKNLAARTLPGYPFDVIYNGIDTDQFRPIIKENRGAFTVLSTSRLIERKGIEFLIRGFYEFQKDVKNVKLVLVGDGNLLSYFKNQTKSLQIEHLVEFLNIIPHEQIPAIYQKADVFVLPSLNEGMSNSILEAMASGLPIITTDTGGSHELVSHDNGIIVAKKNSSQITAALNKLYLNKKLSMDMGNKSREKAEKMSWRISAHNYYTIYKNA